MHFAESDWPESRYVFYSISLGMWVKKNICLQQQNHSKFNFKLCRMFWLEAFDCKHSTMYMVQYIWFVWLGNITFFRLSITCSEATTFYKVFHKTRLRNEKKNKLECKDWGKTLNAGFKMKSATLDQIRLQIDKFVQPLKPIQSIQIFIELAFSMKMACSLCSPSLV